MSIEKRFFGKIDGKGDVDIYKITNKNGAFVELMTLGAGIHSINVPDRNGKLGDVVLGFDAVNNYVDPDLGYQGLVVGRYANRIRDAKFSIDGVEYNTPKNQGTWTLHGGGRFSFNIWDVKETGDDFVTFSFFSPDMQDGFPGNFTMTVKYTFDDSNTLKIEYTVLSDKKTVANPTNHSYFNLSAFLLKRTKYLVKKVLAHTRTCIVNSHHKLNIIFCVHHFLNGNSYFTLFGKFVRV